MKPTTNEDLSDRLEQLESKVDAIYSKLDQAAGAWTFVKILCSLAAGLIVAWNTLHGWFK